MLLLIAFVLLAQLVMTQPRPAVLADAVRMWDFYSPNPGDVIRVLDLDRIPHEAGQVWVAHRQSAYRQGALISAGLIAGGACEAGVVLLTGGVATPLCFAAGLAVAGSVQGEMLCPPGADPALCAVAGAVGWAGLGAGFGRFLRGGAALPAAARGRHRLRQLYRGQRRVR